MLLAHPALSETLRLEMMGSYFDQAHMIRDIRRYTGRTPRQLQVPTLARGLLIRTPTATAQPSYASLPPDYAKPAFTVVMRAIQSYLQFGPIPSELRTARNAPVKPCRLCRRYDVPGRAPLRQRTGERG